MRLTNAGRIHSALARGCPTTGVGKRIWPEISSDGFDSKTNFQSGHVIAPIKCFNAFLCLQILPMKRLVFILYLGLDMFE
jgi:hypothetical protein